MSQGWHDDAVSVMTYAHRKWLNGPVYRSAWWRSKALYCRVVRLEAFLDFNFIEKIELGLNMIIISFQ